MRRRAILFDLDGTLVDSAHDIAAALNDVRQERGAGPLSIEAVRPLVALGAETLVARGLGAAAAEPAADLAAFRARLRAIPASRDAIYPEVAQTLPALAAAGCRMAIVTNKPEALSVKLLAELDLARFFDAVVGGDSTPRPKPAPEPIAAALLSLDATAEGAFFVGDSGIDAAAAATHRIPFLLFTGGYGAADCAEQDIAARFASHGELAGLIWRLASI